MKKSIFLVALVLGSLLVSCKPGEDKPDVSNVVITINPSELTLSPESEGYRLQAILDPKVDNLEITWASSDTSIVTVSNTGIVTPTGRNVGQVKITASAEGVKQNGTCIITVDLYSAYEPNDYGLFGEFEYIAGTDTTLTLSDGDYECQKATIHMYLWDKGIISGASGMSGAGLMVGEQVAVYVITKGDYAGYYVGAGGFAISTKVTPADVKAGKAMYTAAAGKLKDINAYAAYLTLNDELNEQEEEPTEAQIEELMGYYAAALEGATIVYYSYEDRAQSLDLGFAADCSMKYDDEQGLLYQLNFRWFERVNNWFGLKLNEDGSELVKPLQMVYEDRYYEYLGEQEKEEVVRKGDVVLYSPKNIRPISQLPTRLQSLVELHQAK